MNEIRCFIAIDIPEIIRLKISQVFQSFNNLKNREIRWVHPSNIHLTLRFLGNILPNDLIGVRKILNDVVGRYCEFPVSIQSMGVFPNTYRPRVIWVGTVPATELFELQQEIESELTRNDFLPDNHPFSPHITIGRVSNAIRHENISQINEYLARWRDEQFGIYSVSQIHLYRSELRPTGPIYSSLFVANLKPM